MGKLFNKIDKDAFVVPALITVIVLTIGVVAPEAFGKVIDVAFNWLSSNLGWFYDVGLFVLLIFCIWAAFSKVGKIRLGGSEAKPNMTMLSWIAVTFTSGMALGVVFYGVGEGLMNFMDPPGFTGMEAGSAQAAEAALSYVFFHWGFHPYAIYTAAGLGFAFVYWNCKRPFSLSSGLYPLLGEKGEKGLPGKIINWLCLYIMVATLGTNVGLATLQISAGLKYAYGNTLPDSILAPIIILVIAITGITCACSGVHKAIKYVSSANMVVFIILVGWSFVFGGTQFTINNMISSVGEYLKILIPESFYLEPAVQSGWISGWTLFYWAWWLTVAPLTGLFLMKLAKGRTIREFIMVNMFIPIGFIVIWFGTFGSSAIFQQMNGAPIWEAIQEFGFPVSLFAYLKNLPLAEILTIFGFLAIFMSFLTQNESMIYTMAGMTAADKGETEIGEQKSPFYLKIFWGVAIALMGYILLLSGGLEVVQRSVVMLGIPVLIILLINAASFVKATTHRLEYDLTLTEKQKEKLRQLQEEEEI
ncbi:MAG: BCCT family transporter [Lachnospiraceae bacterium]|nr:BCCT family transporter [Lachnospiraceae bacterium]